MTKIARSKNALTADFNESKVIYNLKTLRGYILNRTGIELWDFLKKPRQGRAVAEFLQSRYNIDKALSRKESRRFIRALSRRGFLERKEPAACR
ncbi:PqqD family protein [Candidatus Omnitrophota bacterium]